MAHIAQSNAGHSDDLVVALSHADVVLEELDRLVERELLDERPSLGPSNDVLGLGLIPLKFRRDAVALEAVGTSGAAEFGVTEVLAMMRDSCSYRYRGWLPTVGKNRVLSGIAGEGGFLAGGGGFLAGGGGFLAGGGGFLAGGGGFLAGGGGGLPSVPTAAPSRPRGSRGAAARIAVLDTQVYRGTALGKHVRYIGKYLPRTSSMPVESGHATFVLGLVERAAPGATVEVRPALDEHAVASAWSVACAMAALVEADLDVLNLSLGCYTLDNQPPLLLQRAVEVLAPKLLIVAAAGNHRQPHYPRPFWPAAFEQVVAVGATDDKGRLASFSPRAPWVDVTAPGVDIVSTYLDGKVELKAATEHKPAQTEDFPGYAQWRGTSFAAASVAGEIAAHVKATRSASKALRHILQLPEGTSPVRPYTHS